MGIEMQISMNDPRHSLGIMDTDSLRGRRKNRRYYLMSKNCTVFPGISASLKLL